MEADEANTARVDKWLWAVRIFKTRPLATAACREGKVSVGELVAKPARTVRAGEIVTVRQGVMQRTLRVVAAPASRVGAVRLPEFYVDLTPPEEFAQARAQRAQQANARAPGAGRPTKRDRRLQDRFFG
jgi:ribosome-associated heat shock protein Hsp15